jgi:hypothetical protein
MTRIPHFRPVLACCAAALFGVLALGTPLRGAVTILDSFSDGEFALSYGPVDAIRTSLDSSVARDRLAAGNGFSNWSAVQEGGRLAYTVDLRGLYPNFLLLSYDGRGSPMNLLPHDSFEITVLDVVGTGQLYVGFGQQPGFSQPLEITGPGSLNYPFANVFTSASYDRLSAIEFWFVATSTDFSITVDQIAVVPEPASAFLVLTGLGGVLLRRRRRGVLGMSV